MFFNQAGQTFYDTAVPFFVLGDLKQNFFILARKYTRRMYVGFRGFGCILMKSFQIK